MANYLDLNGTTDVVNRIKAKLNEKASNDNVQVVVDELALKADKEEIKTYSGIQLIEAKANECIVLNEFVPLMDSYWETGNGAKYFITSFNPKGNACIDGQTILLKVSELPNYDNDEKIALYSYYKENLFNMDYKATVYISYSTKEQMIYLFVGDISMPLKESGFNVGTLTDVGGRSVNLRAISSSSYAQPFDHATNDYIMLQLSGTELQYCTWVLESAYRPKTGLDNETATIGGTSYDTTKNKISGRTYAIKGSTYRDYDFADNEFLSFTDKGVKKNKFIGTVNGEKLCNTYTANIKTAPKNYKYAEFATTSNSVVINPTQETTGETIPYVDQMVSQKSYRRFAHSTDDYYTFDKNSSMMGWVYTLMERDTAKSVSFTADVDTDDNFIISGYTDTGMFSTLGINFYDVTTNEQITFADGVKFSDIYFKVETQDVYLAVDNYNGINLTKHGKTYENGVYQNINGTISKIASTDDVYTKTEIDEKIGDINNALTTIIG